MSIAVSRSSSVHSVRARRAVAHLGQAPGLLDELARGRALRAQRALVDRRARVALDVDELAVAGVDDLAAPTAQYGQIDSVTFRPAIRGRPARSLATTASGPIPQSARATHEGRSRRRGEDRGRPIAAHLPRSVVHLLPGLLVDRGRSRWPGTPGRPPGSDRGRPLPTTTAMSSIANTSGRRPRSRRARLQANSSIVEAVAHAASSSWLVGLVIACSAISRRRPGRRSGRPTSRAATGPALRGEHGGEVARGQVALDPTTGRRRAASPTHWMRTPYWSLQKLGSGAARRRRAAQHRARRGGRPGRPAASQCCAAGASPAAKTPGIAVRRRRRSRPLGRGRCRRATPWPARRRRPRRPRRRRRSARRRARAPRPARRRARRSHGAPASTSTPSSRCSRANHAPSCSPRIAASGVASASISVTSAPSRARVAATSWPMKPAPTTASRVPGAQRLAQPARVAERAQLVHVLEAGQCRGSRRGALPVAISELVVAQLAPRVEEHAARAGVQRHGAVRRAAARPRAPRTSPAPRKASAASSRLARPARPSTAAGGHRAARPRRTTIAHAPS